MKTSIRFHLIAVICALTLSFGAFSYISVTTRAEGAYAEAKKAAQDAVAKALELAKKCKELNEAAAQLEAAAAKAEAAAAAAEAEAKKAKDDADEAMKGKQEFSNDGFADGAAEAADEAAAAADKAQDEAQRAGGKDKEKNKAAADAEARLKEAEKHADGLDKTAADFDKEFYKDPELEKTKEAARAKRKQARAARRAAAKARRDADAAQEAARKPCDDAEAARAAAEESLRKADELLAEKSGESGNRPPKKLVEEKKKLDKLREDLQGNVIPPSAGVVTKSIDGMLVITFDTSAGNVKVNLPDDMRAGDTISGTVVAEPKGNNDAERRRNMEELSGYVVELRPPVLANTSKSFIGDTGNNRVQRVNPDGLAPPSGSTGAIRGTLVFVGDTANNRFQRSTDGGRTWQVFTGGTGSGGSSGVAPKPQTPPRALLRSMNGGSWWEVIDGGAPAFTLRLDQGPGGIDVGLNRLTQDSTPLPGKVIATKKFEIYDYPGEYPEPKGIANSRPVTVGMPSISPQGAVLTNVSLDPKIENDKPLLWCPTIAQQGRPVEIHGSFDGSFDNTTLRVGGQEATILVESQRTLVFQSPTNITGPVEMALREGNVVTKRTYRNVGVRLSAPKTNLLKGEATTLTVKVEGLQGIKEDVPIHLENASPTVVTMAGGDKQTYKIAPSTLQPDGTFSTTRAITGQQAGSFSVTATVVVFRHCLQDDSEPARVLLWNGSTGDYIFCSGPVSSAGANPISLSTMDSSGGVSVRAGETLDIIKRGKIAHTDYNFETPGTSVLRRKIHLELNGYTHTGSATVQTMTPRQTFTITDRDTRNNTCTCQ